MAPRLITSTRAAVAMPIDDIATAVATSIATKPSQSVCERSSPNASAAEDEVDGDPHGRDRERQPAQPGAISVVVIGCATRASSVPVSCSSLTFVADPERRGL